MEISLVKSTIKACIVSVLKHENFEMKDELVAADVKGWDSLSHMLIINEIEYRFKIKFKLKELNRITNMGSLIETIVRKIDS